jgi:uncharacterized protein YdiU (UPF0061 family)
LNIIEPHPFESLGEKFSSVVEFQELKGIQSIYLNKSFIKESLDPVSVTRLENILRGSEQPDQGISMVYAGHQFGQQVPQLGDGRGLMIGMIEDLKLDLHIKGAGKTPYSRFGDGRAVTRSVIREYLVGEAMHALNIPTSRALMMVFSNEPVFRETTEKGSQLLRTSKTHIRFGHFEYFAFTNQKEALYRLLDWCIENYFSELSDDKEKYAAFFREIVQRTAWMIADWQSIGFCHGVMNTDNMNILGETFDYGPYGFMETYNSKHVCNHTDTQARYSYQNQPLIGLWNCSVLAKALEEVIDGAILEGYLKEYEIEFQTKLLQNFRNKLGLFEEDKNDPFLIQELLNLMETNHLDFTTSFLSLESILAGDHSIIDKEWVDKFAARHDKESTSLEDRIQHCKAHNPKFILRNYHIQNVIEAAEKGDFTKLESMESIAKNPFELFEDFEEYYQPSPPEFNNLPLSCSS